MLAVEHLDGATQNMLDAFTYTWSNRNQRLSETRRRFDDQNGALLSTAEFAWAYDGLGRLIEERYDTEGTADDYTTRYEHDLVGNRLTKETDRESDDTIDETITYAYDANDRLLTEALDSDGVPATIEKTTVYTYGPSNAWTVQTARTIFQGTDTSGSGTVLESTTYTYNLQGRLSQIDIDTDGDLDVDTRTQYTYDDTGIRTQQTVTTDVSGTPDETTTRFLNDANNLTGFSQVLEEWLDNGGLTLAKSYAIAHDIVSQYDAATDALHVLLYDVHGSTRALADSGGEIVPGHVFDYTAYGELLTHSPEQAAALLTTILFSGEQVDARTGLSYLRGRYYRLSTGTFMSSDPFAGDTAVPLTLHKYLYVHGDPVNLTDPLGLFSLIETQLATSISVMFDAIEAEVAFAAQDAARGAQAGLTVQQVIQQNIAQLALFGGAALGASLVWQASFAAFNRGTNLIRANLGASRLFEAKAVAYATFTRGETVILTQFKRGAADRGFDFLSFAGRGRSARLYINEAKSVSGRVSGGTFTAFGLGAGKGRTLRENLDAARAAIRRSGLDSVTQDTLLLQLGPNGGAQIRLFGDADKGTRFTPSVLERIGQATGFITGVGALL